MLETYFNKTRLTSSRVVKRQHRSLCSSVVWQKCATSRRPGGWRRRKRINWKIRRSACTQHELFHLRLSCCSQKLPSSSPANECQSPFRMTRRRWSHDSRITASGLIKVYINKSVSYANGNHAEAAETITTDETTGRGAVGHLFLTSSRLSNFYFFFVFLGAKKHWIIPFGTALASYLRAPSLGLARVQRQSVRACVPCFHQWLNFPDWRKW